MFLVPDSRIESALCMNVVVSAFCLVSSSPVELERLGVSLKIRSSSKTSRSRYLPSSYLKVQYITAYMSCIDANAPWRLITNACIWIEDS